LALVTTTTDTNHFETQSNTQGVFVGDVSAARGVRFRALIVPGLIDGSFPRPARQDPLLLDAERQHLAETVGCEIGQRSQQNEEDRLLFSLIAHSAIDYLILTYPSQDQASGHAHMPSWYLLRVLEALRGTPQTFADLESWCHRVPLVPVYTGPPDKAPHTLGTPDTLDTFEFHLSSVEQAVATGDASPLGYLPSFAPAFLHAQQANVQRWEQDRLTPFDGMLESPEARSVLHQRLFPAGIVVSASGLETYARCPFRYFLSAVLGLEPRQDPEQILTLRPQDRGLLLHDILHDFFSQLRTAGQLPVADNAQQVDPDSHALSQRLIQTAQKHFAHFAETHPTGFALLWELEKERMHERLALLLKRERQIGAEFVPEAFEAHFGLGMSQRFTEAEVAEISDDVLESPFFPEIPVQFVLDDGEIIGLRGRIDRIDLSPGDQPQARIIDYKTGKPPRGQFAKGMVLQLPLYLFAAQTLRPELLWESARYVGVDGSERNTPAAFTAQTWPEALRTLRHIMTIVVTGVRSGCFFPQPDTCYPCPFPEICGSQVGKQMMRKRNDPRLLAFHQLRSIA
jgi:ATP-dependent helicase/DNAse subunit B